MNMNNSDFIMFVALSLVINMTANPVVVMDNCIVSLKLLALGLFFAFPMLSSIYVYSIYKEDFEKIGSSSLI
jgi:hypothetical protein